MKHKCLSDEIGRLFNTKEVIKTKNSLTSDKMEFSCKDSLVYGMLIHQNLIIKNKERFPIVIGPYTNKV